MAEVGPKKLSYYEQGLAKWSPRVGEKAANLKYRGVMISTVAGLFFMGYMVTYSIGRLSHINILQLAGWALAGLSFVSLFVNQVFQHYYYINASRYVGIRVSTFHGIPSTRDHYLKWCEKNGIKPFTPCDDFVKEELQGD